jgi:hypothetical protein
MMTFSAENRRTFSHTFSYWSLALLPVRQCVHVSIESRYCLLSRTRMMRELHENAMNIMAQSGVHTVYIAPLLLFILTVRAIFRSSGGDSFFVRPKCTIQTRVKLKGGSGVFRHAPDTPQATWTRRQPHPTLLSIAGVPGEVSRQQVACFFPVASHFWLDDAGSRGRQGTRR